MSLLACLPRVFLARPVAASFGPPAVAANKPAKAQPAFSSSTWLGKLAKDVRGGGRFPWKPRPIDRIRQWLLSPRFKLALEVAVGLLWTSLFTFVRQLSFNESCLGAVFVLAVLLLLSPDSHLGSQLMGMATVLFSAAFSPVYAGRLRFANSCLGSVFLLLALIVLSPDTHVGSQARGGVGVLWAAWAAPTYSGAVISLARTPGRAFAGTLITFAVVAFILLACLRASPGNPGPGIIASLIYGVAILNSITAWPAKILWHHVVAYLMAAMTVAGSGALLATALVLPTLAGDELRQVTATAIQGMGHTLSAYASTLFMSSEQQQVHHESSIRSHGSTGRGSDKRAAGDISANFISTSMKNLRKQMGFPEEKSTIVSFLKAIRKRTDPDRETDAQPCILNPAPSHEELRKKLDRAKALVGEADFEPAFLQSGPQDVRKWGKLVASAQSLVTRIAALHLLIEGGHLLNSQLLMQSCLVDPLPSFRVVYAELAAACLTLGEAVKHAGTPKAEAFLTAVPWQQIRLELVDAITAARIGFWTRIRQQAAPDRPKSGAALEIRVLLFLVTLTTGIIDALADLERDLPVALGYEAEDSLRQPVILPRVIGPNEVAELHNKELSTASAPSTHSGSGSSSRSNAEGGGLATEAEPEASNACAAPASEQSEPQMRNFGGSTVSALERDELRAFQGTAAVTDPSSPDHSHQQHATAAAVDRGSGEGGPAPQQPGIAIQQENGVISCAEAEQDRDRQDSNKAASTSGLGEVRIKISQPLSSQAKRRVDIRSELLQNTRWLLNIAKILSGYDPALRLKKVFWDDLKRALSSRRELLAALKSRRVQYGLKFWLTGAIAISLTVSLASNYPNTRTWRLYYGYITALIVCIERVEATAWKIIQRIMGTLLGGTLGYLIMLNAGVHSHGAAVLALVCVSSFVISQGLGSYLQYTVFLTLVTMTSLTVCQYPQCCTPGSDFRLWVIRCLNIVVGCAVAMAIIWAVLPWYASDEHLALLADAYEAAGDLVAQFYTAFYAACKAAAEGKSEEAGAIAEKEEEFQRELEGHVVRPVEAVLLGLQRDTVIWHSGLLSSPPIVQKLTRAMQGLVWRLAALELAVTQGPEEFGPYTASIYNHFIAPMHAENQALMAAIRKLTHACGPILRRGSTEARVLQVQAALAEVEQCRVAVSLHYQQLHRCVQLHSLADSDSPTGGITAADSIKLSSWMLAASKVFDQMMLIARTVISDGCKARDNHLTSLYSFSVSSKSLS